MRSITAKESASRSGSTSTSAPSAPRAMSSHICTNRCWPGVPNRYSTTRSLMVSRPKSMATVVVVLPWTPLRSSTASAARVIVSSVDSGSISEIEPMNVVLPTAKGPTTRIFTAVWVAPPRTEACSPKLGAETIEHLLQDLPVGEACPRHRRSGDEVAALRQGGQQDPHDPQRQPGVPGQLGHREVAGGADVQQTLLLRGQPGRPLRVLRRRRHQGDEGELLLVRQVPAPGDDVRPY